ncbi:MAG: hypothetical protein JW942_01830 [Opitutales bacterium]|nr:hypothetical protein [Opitutales bacterium]
MNSNKTLTSQAGAFSFSVKLLVRTLILLTLSVILGALSLYLNPHAPSYGEDILREGEIDLESALAIKDVVWVDARSGQEFERSRAKDSININEDDYYTQVGEFLARWKNDKTVIVYCSSDACSSAENIAERLRREAGADKVFVLHGGWKSVFSSGKLTLASGKAK